MSSQLGASPRRVQNLVVGGMIAVRRHRGRRSDTSSGRNRWIRARADPTDGRFGLVVVGLTAVVLMAPRGRGAGGRDLTEVASWPSAFRYPPCDSFGLADEYRITAELVERLPAALWHASVPGLPRRTIRMIAAHLHNSRCGWIRTLGSEHGVAVPDRVDPRLVSRRPLVAALKRSSRGMEALLGLGFAAGGVLPPSKRYVWRNLPLDVAHVLSYFVAHEAHHRGQIVMVARQLGEPLPRSAIDGLWQWQIRKKRR